MTTIVRVGIRVTPGLRTWAGGYNYIRNLLSMLRAYPGGHVQPLLFAGPEVPVEDVGELAALVDEPLAVDAAWSTGNLFRTARTIAAGTDARAARALGKVGVDVLFEQGAFYGRNFPVPTLVWMADFQHCYLPEMFGRFGSLRREVISRLKTAGTRTIMVSSRAARADCIRFYGVTEERISVVPFAVLRSLHTVDPALVRARYGVPERFFFLPNQLWRHKNHRLVCEALVQLRQRGKSVCVIASGSTFDPRNPSLYKDLQTFIEREGIKEEFRHLGAIPYHDLIGLLRGSTALINPSRFEGWSTTVEEAKSYGVPLIVSDIPVHREQVSADSILFDPMSASQLADALVAADESLPPGPRPDAEDTALTKNAERAARFADNFGTAVRTALSRK